MPDEKGDGVKFRSAFVIVITFAVSVVICSTFMESNGQNNAHLGTIVTPSAPVVYSQPRTELLPPEAALYDPPTTTTTTTAPSAPADTVTPYERVEWSRVNVCENGGSWIPQGSAYPDGLGISAVNWYGNGGGSDLSEDAQIMVAERIQFNPPDQDGGCAPW